MFSLCRQSSSAHIGVTTPDTTPAAAAMEVPPVVQPGHTMDSVTLKISTLVLRRRTPLWWLAGFFLAFLLVMVLLVAVTYLFLRGVGIWGIEIPVAWGFAITNFVWWIGIGHAGTLISAVAYELVFEAVKMSTGTGFPAFGFFTGALVFFFSDRFISMLGAKDHMAIDAPEGSPLIVPMVLAIILDGIPESIVIGLGLSEGGKVSIAMLKGTALLSLLPLAILGGGAWYLRRRARQVAAAEAAREAAPAPAAARAARSA